LTTEKIKSLGNQHELNLASNMRINVINDLSFVWPTCRIFSENDKNLRIFLVNVQLMGTSFPIPSTELGCSWAHVGLLFPLALNLSSQHFSSCSSNCTSVLSPN